MGNVHKKVTHPPVYNAIIDKKINEFLKEVYINFIVDAEVQKVEENTIFGDISHRWTNKATKDMQEFYLTSIDNNFETKSEISTTNKHNKTDKCRIVIKIYENNKQHKMMAGIREVPGKAIKLTTIREEFSESIFESSGWSGIWYNNGLTGHIAITKNTSEGNLYIA